MGNVQTSEPPFGAIRGLDSFSVAFLNPDEYRKFQELEWHKILCMITTHIVVNMTCS